MGYPANTNPGQKGAAYSQYGGQAKGPSTSPYMMNSNVDENKRENDYNRINGNPNPNLPVNIQPGPDKMWYPGMYPSTQPQFGSNPYAPQTSNLSGHPGHNPSTIPAVEPNQSNTAYSDHGQFVRSMASGGSSFSGPAKIWAGSGSNPPANVSQPDGLLSAVPPMLSQIASNSTLVNPGLTGIAALIAQNNPDFQKALGIDNSNNQAHKFHAQAQTTQPVNPVYVPRYTQAPMASNLDSWGNPLY